MKKISYLILLVSILFFNNCYAESVPQNYSFSQVDAGLKKVNGDTGEYVMHKVFKKNGWRQLEGEIGGSGIDGLYVKYDKNGNVKKVMIAESKYGSSNLGTNKYGTDQKNIKQMSKKGLLYQTDNLIKQYPDSKEYMQIRRHIEVNNHRVRLFQLKVVDNILSFEVKKISPNGDIGIVKDSLFGRENYKINGLKIDFENPKTEFERRVVKYYNQGRIIALQKKFKISAIDAQSLVSKHGKLTAGHIEKTLSYKTQVFNTVARNYSSTLKSISRTYNKPYRLKKKINTFWKKKYTKILIRKIK